MTETNGGSAEHWLPPVTHTSEGTMRTVGIELEFAGISHTATTDAVAAWAGVEAEHESLVEATVKHPQLGTFEIEVDWRYLKQTAQEQQISEGPESWVKLLRQAAQRLVPVPVEVVAPPVALEQLPELEGLIEQLRGVGAQGTEDSPFAAYGLHINPQVQEVKAATILPYMQAFALLQWWLVEYHQVDMTRRLSPWVHLYPDAYLNQVLGYWETPSLDQLLVDYHTHNPTRNRALDMWPLFAHYDGDRVQQLMNEPLIKARPTFHYRLPNCNINKPDWHLRHEWQAWLAVERLAADKTARQQLIGKFFSTRRPWLGVHRRQWIATVEQWLNDR